MEKDVGRRAKGETHQQASHRFRRGTLAWLRKGRPTILATLTTAATMLGPHVDSMDEAIWVSGKNFDHQQRKMAV